MDGVGRSVAGMIESAELALAAGAVSRDSCKDLPAGFAPRASAVYRLQVLAQSLAIGAPEVLCGHLGWERVALRARDVPDDYLVGHVDSLEAELLERLPEIAHGCIREQSEAARQHLATAPFELPSGMMVDRPHVVVARGYLLALLEGRKDDAVQLVLNANLSILDVYRHVLQPVLEEVGRMWQQAELHTAEEHFATAVTERVMAMLSLRPQEQASDGRIAIVASVADNLHSLGPRMVADTLEHGGWNAVMLGANMPSVDLPVSVRDHQAQLLALSITLPTQLIVAADSIRAVREAHPSVRVIVGGAVVSKCPGLASKLGADGLGADCIAAAEVADELVPPRGLTG